MIDLLAKSPDNMLGFAYKGKVTKENYEILLIPALVKALQTLKHVRLYLDLEPDFSGCDAGAIWEDLKVGIGHRASWERVAVVTDNHWIEQVTRFYRILLDCSMKTFPTSEAAQARAWITAPG